jgi:hypothetical protein
MRGFGAHYYLTPVELKPEMQHLAKAQKGAAILLDATA